MKRVVALILVPIWSGIANADAGPLPNTNRYVPVTITLTVDREYPDHAIFLVGHHHSSSEVVQRVSLSPSEPLVFRSDEGPRPSSPNFKVYAVPKKELDRLGQPIPRLEWFNRINPEPANEFYAGFVGDRGNVSFDDNRERIEKTYRLEILPEGSRVVLVAENEGNRWVKRGWIAAIVLPPMGIALLGIWLSRRLLRNRS